MERSILFREALAEPLTSRERRIMSIVDRGIRNGNADKALDDILELLDPLPKDACSR